MSSDDSRPDRIHVIGGFFRTFNALGARQQVLVERRKFGFVHNHAKREHRATALGIEPFRQEPLARPGTRWRKYRDGFEFVFF